MSIVLNVEKYCEDCPGFAAKLDSRTLCDGYGQPVTISHTITCERRDTCAMIVNYLKERD